MLPQHLVCKYELNCEYRDITLTRNKAPWWWSDKIGTYRSVLNVFYVRLYVHSLVEKLKWFYENARCYNKIIPFLFPAMPRPYRVSRNLDFVIPFRITQRCRVWFKYRTVPLPGSDRIVTDRFEIYFSRWQRNAVGAKNLNTAICGRTVNVLRTMHLRRLLLPLGISRRLFPDALSVRNKTAAGENYKFGFFRLLRIILRRSLLYWVETPTTRTGLSTAEAHSWRCELASKFPFIKLRTLICHLYLQFTLI